MKYTTKRPESAQVSPSGTINPPDFPLIVHSHLNWDWVWQRPQQLLSRFSERHRVLFVEEPRLEPALPSSTIRVREVADFPNILILQMSFPASRAGEPDWLDGERRRLLQSFLAAPIGAKFVKPVQWFYDPKAVTAFAGQMDERAIVYDCMDQLSQFRYAAADLAKRERELLTLSDVVFAGGPRIWEEKSKYNANCFCFGCGVDVEHFAASMSPSIERPADVRALPGPVFGYFGVVDERLDYDLIAALADANPEGSVVLVGPFAKIDQKDLPRRENLHWLGGRDYSQLPNYAAAFDVCLMPFALNEATEFINPTKALEYFATGTPVVSTPVHDVVRQFREIVRIAPTQRDFIEACAEATTQSNDAAIRRGLELARQNTWEAIVHRMQGHIADALARTSQTEASAA